MGNVKSLLDKKCVNVINGIMISIKNRHKKLSDKLLALTVVNSPNSKTINNSQSAAFSISSTNNKNKVVIAKGDSAASEHYWR